MSEDALAKTWLDAWGYRYRDDGWPLCPICEEDELYSTVPPSISLKPQATDRMKCYRCHWEGVVPVRQVH